MLIDAHCHPYDLSGVYTESEFERKQLGVIALASACNMGEFEYCKKLENVLAGFAIHPQLCASALLREDKFIEHLEILDKLASEKRLAAVGECGFDLYGSQYKATEKLQINIFEQHLDIAIKYDLPVILHIRRAMHKIFSCTNQLKKCKAVVFHSWPGTLEEGKSLLRRGVNAYFSFGNTIFNGHKQQIRSCAGFSQDRILTETDAPYQPVRGAKFSSWKDLPRIIEAIAALRNIDRNDLEIQIEKNFYNCALIGSP